MSKLATAWEWCKGKKTYLVGVIGLAYGLIHRDQEIIMTSLVALGLRDAIASK